MEERLSRTVDALREAGADWAILTGCDSVCYATGYVAAIETGPSPFAGGPTTAFIGADGATGLVVANVEAAPAGEVPLDELVGYDGFTVDRPGSPAEGYQAAVRQLARRLGVAGVLAIERGSFPASLDEALPGTERVDLAPSLARVRAVKTEAEIDLLRRCAETAAVGQRAFLRAVRPGATELAVFAEIRAAMEEHAGSRLAVGGDFLSGRRRTAGCSGWPTARRLERGDPVLADLGPRVQGYWGDSCAAVTLGEPSRGFERLFHAAKSALEHAISVLRPGITAARLDAEVRGHVERAGFHYPHHTGHSIGAAVHELPRIVPHDTTPLERDMVLMVEPGAYDAEVGGVRCEWMLRVTPGGCEPLAPFQHVVSVACPPA